MATQAGILHSPRLKAMVIPREHGAWGMLLVPLATGAVTAAGSDAHYGSLSLLLVGALALFWSRTPLEAWLGTTPIKAHSAEERATVLGTALLLAAVGTAAIILLAAMGYAKGLLLIGAIAVASFVLQAMMKSLGRIGRMPAQVIGSVGLTATAAAAYYVTGGRLDRLGFELWAVNWLFAGNQIHFVQIRIRLSRVETSIERVRRTYGFLAGQFLLLAAILGCSSVGIVPKYTVIAFIPALVRGSLWFLRRRQPLDVQKLGFSELRQALLFGTLLCFAFLG